MYADALVNSLHEAIFLFDRSGLLVFLNKRAEEFYGKALRELRNRSCNDLFPAWTDLNDLVKKSIGESRSFTAREVEVDVGRTATVDVSITPFYRVDSIDGAVLCLREHLDLTEREDVHFDAILYLLGSIAHEVRNPLSGIKGAAQILKGHLGRAEPAVSECISHILRESERLNGVVQSYLTMTRRPVFNLLNVHEVIEYALKVMEHAIREKNIVVEKQYDPSLPMIYGDESKLLQVIINLLQNGIEAIDGDGKSRTLGISTMPSGEYVIVRNAGERRRDSMPAGKRRWAIIRVRDTGRGIPRDLVPSIFLPFITGRPGGSGLGLALSKKIVKDHGGIIRVKSKVGAGSEFSVYLPYKSTGGGDRIAEGGN